jgi:hypothetical protein
MQQCYHQDYSRDDRDHHDRQDDSPAQPAQEPQHPHERFRRSRSARTEPFSRSWLRAHRLASRTRDFLSFFAHALQMVRRTIFLPHFQHFDLFFMSQLQDSNPSPPRYKPGALA